MLGMHNINLTLAKCGKLPGTLAIFTVLGPVRPHTIPFYHPFYPDVTHKKRYQAFSHFSVLQAIFIPRYSVHKSEESNQQNTLENMFIFFLTTAVTNVCKAEIIQLACSVRRLHALNVFPRL